MVRISGNINEFFGKTKIPNLGTSTQIDILCENIQSMNSAGVKAWIHYFRNLRITGHTVRFYNLSPVMTQLIALNISITDRNEVVSIKVPLLCSNCKAEAFGLHYVSNGVQGLMRLCEQTACRCCGQKMFLDDVPQDYVNVQRKNTHVAQISNYKLAQSIVNHAA